MSNESLSALLSNVNILLLAPFFAFTFMFLVIVVGIVIYSYTLNKGDKEKRDRAEPKYCPPKDGTDHFLMVCDCTEPIKMPSLHRDICKMVSHWPVAVNIDTNLKTTTLTLSWTSLPDSIDYKKQIYRLAKKHFTESILVFVPDVAKGVF